MLFPVGAVVWAAALCFYGRIIAGALSCFCLLFPACAITRFAMGRKIAGALSCFCLFFPACAITRFAMGRKIAIALSCECRRTTFSGAAFCLSPLLGMCVPAWLPYWLLCAAPVVASRRVGRCPTPCKGRCPLTPQASGARLDRALFNALRVWVYSFVRLRRQSIFAARTYFRSAALRRPREDT